MGDVGEILDEARTEFPAPPRPKEPCHNKENTLESGIANPKMKLGGNEKIKYIHRSVGLGVAFWVWVWVEKQ